jgi:electron transfer flavoprotein alpha subunit
MAGVLVYSDSLDLALELAGFAAASGQDSYALSLSRDQTAVLASSGVGRVLEAAVEPDLPEACAKSIAESVAARNIGLVLVGATSRGRDLAARVAGYLDCGFGADVVDLVVEGESVSFGRSLYGGKAISKERIDGMAVVTMGRGSAVPAHGEAAVEPVDIAADDRMTLVSRQPIANEGVDLAKADRVVGIGMGVSTEEDVREARCLAEDLGGAIACSRGIAEERKWLPADRYIGISGKVIAPALYLSLGISGQIQHLFGVRDAKIVAAVDKNENALIFKNADYFIVGDVHQMIPALEKAVAGRERVGVATSASGVAR